MPSDESIRSAIREVLARAEFTPRDDPFSDWLQRLLLWLTERGIGLPTWLTWLLFAVLAFFIARFLARWLTELTPPAPVVRKSAPASVVQVTRGAALTFADAMRLARQALESGDLRQALWIGHRLLLLRLDEKGALRFADGKTNSDYLRECPQDALLRELTEWYDRVVYGQRAANAEAVANLLAAVERL